MDSTEELEETWRLMGDPGTIMAPFVPPSWVNQALFPTTLKLRWQQDV